ncbi:MAG: glycosyltransferase [Bacteroidia bacterium]
MVTANLNLFEKKILLAPLDWGFGHVARCVPLVKKLQEQSNHFIIACTPQQKQFLQQELNNIEYVDLFGYNIRYSAFLPLWLKILVQLPKLYFVVRKENRWLTNYLQKNKIDIVISDNRFGFYNKSVESIFITHQLNIQVPAFKKVINRINDSFIKNYSKCWVPDYTEKEKRLSGILSDYNKQLKNIEFINPLSRFQKKEPQQNKYDVLILLSGPEPQRSILEDKLVSVFLNTNYTIALARGTVIPRERKIPDNFFVIDIASTKQLQELFNSSEKIICRSGYSTLMDLYALRLNALLIPTPGQTEQEYLANYWGEKFGYTFIEQKHITQERIETFMKSELQ